MKKMNCLFLSAVVILMIYSSGCTEVHEMAEASLDNNHLDYKGPSPYPPPLGTPAENLTYLIFEDVWLDFLPPLDWFFDSGSGNSVYNPSNYDPGNAPFIQGNLRYLPSAPKSKPRMSLLLSEGLSYVAKGGKEKDGTVTTVTRLNYLDVPVLINYFGSVGNTKNAYHVGVGPWVAYALSGKFKSTGQSPVGVKFGSSGDFARLDYGAGFKAGVSFSKKWDVSLGYDLGMRNLLGTQGVNNDGDKAHTKNLSLSIGYWFK